MEIKTIKMGNKDFLIVREIETGRTFLAAPYHLDGDKLTAFCEFIDNGVEPEMDEFPMYNFYRYEVMILGSYTSQKYSRSRDNRITRE